MKIAHLLNESINRNLARYLKSNSSKFEVVGNYNVFIWTNELLRALIKNGAKTNDELSTVVTPGSIGVGIINTRTGDICVGAIDQDYDALWVSNMDVSDFLVNTKNKNLIRLPNRLQNLADLLADYEPPNKNSPFKSDKSGVDAIIDTIKNDDTYYNISEARFIMSKISKMTNVKDVKDFLDNAIQKLKSESSNIPPDTLTFKEFRKRAHSGTIAKYIEVFLERESHLFKEDQEEQNEDIQEKLDKWIDHFNRDFPNLDVQDPLSFDPNY
jgi:hypothetical protein